MAHNDPNMIKVVILGVAEKAIVCNIPREEWDAAPNICGIVNAQPIHMEHHEEPGMVRKTLSTVGGGVKTTAKAAAYGSIVAKEKTVGFFKGIVNTVKKAGEDMDKRQAVKKQEKEEVEACKEHVHEAHSH